MGFALLLAMQVEIVAHRGASDDAPENTLAAFRLGFELADAVELDVHPSKDGHAVVIHDKSTKRTAGVDRPVAGQTLAELKALDAGLWKGERWKGERIPTLEEALALVPDGKRLYIEIKGGPEVLPAVKRAVDGSGRKPAQLSVIGFSLDTMKQAKQVLPALPVYWLASAKEDAKTNKAPDLDELLRTCAEAKLDGLDLDYKFPLDAAYVAKVRAAGLKLLVYTVNDEAVARKLAELGVDGITTDRPAALRRSLAR
jgi:glycerophosphoryl diester phosphodiesterase